MNFEDRKRQILRAAEEVFAEKGYRAASLNDIASKVNIKAPGLYYYFKSKRDIYDSLMNDTFSRMKNEVLAPIMEETDPREKVRLLVVRLIDFWAEHPRFPRMLAQETLSGSEFVDRELIPNFLVPMFNEIVKSLDDGGLEAYGFYNVDLPLLVFNVLGITMFYFFSSKILTILRGDDILSPESIENLKAEVLGLVFHGIDRG